MYFRWDLNPQRFPLGCWFLKPVRFNRFATEAYNGGKSKEWFYWRTWTFKSLFLRQMCIPFHEVTLLITIHYFEPPDRFELPTPALQVRCSTVKAIEAYVVVLVGNDPTTSSTSRKRSPIELQGIIFWASCQTRTGVPGLQIQNNQPTIRRMRLRSRLDSNQREWVCNPLPPVFLHHSATGPFLLDWRVTIPLPRRYQLRALTIWATVQFYYSFMYFSMTISTY